MRNFYNATHAYYVMFAKKIRYCWSFHFFACNKQEKGNVFEQKHTLAYCDSRTAELITTFNV